MFCAYENGQNLSFRFVLLTSRNEVPRLSKNTPLANPLIPFTIDTLFSVELFSRSSMPWIKRRMNEWMKNKPENKFFSLKWNRNETGSNKIRPKCSKLYIRMWSGYSVQL